MGFAPDIKVRHEKGGCVIFDTLREKVFVANETGARIVEALNEGLTPEGIAERLGEEYDQSPEMIGREVRLFLNSLRDNGIALPGE